MRITQELKADFRELMHGAKLVARGEATLLREETREALSGLRKLLVVSGIALVAGMALLLFGSAFAVIGVGKLLGGNYWLSALIFTVISGTIALAAGIVSLRKALEGIRQAKAIRADLAEEVVSVKRHFEQAGRERNKAA